MANKRYPVSPEPLIDEYRKALKKSFHALRLKVMKRFEKNGTLERAHEAAQVWRGKSRGKATDAQFDEAARFVIEDMRDLSEKHVVELEGIIRDYDVRGYNLGGKNAHLRLGFSGVFDLRNPAILDAIARRAATLAEVIEEELVDGILKDVTVGYYDKGLNPLQVATRIHRTFDNMELARARRIARTETLIANETASFENYTRAHVDYKAWGAFIDKLTRDDHRILGGQPAIPLAQPFIVPSTGEEMMHPGDPTASAEQLVNCRCYTIPAVKDVKVTEDNLWHGA